MLVPPWGNVTDCHFINNMLQWNLTSKSYRHIKCKYMEQEFMMKNWCPCSRGKPKGFSQEKLQGVINDCPYIPFVPLQSSNDRYLLADQQSSRTLIRPIIEPQLYELFFEVQKRNWVYRWKWKTFSFKVNKSSVHPIPLLNLNKDLIYFKTMK